MSYRVEVVRRAQKQLARIQAQAQDRERLMEAIDALADDPYPAGAIKIQGSISYRIRRGDYRAVYEIDEAARKITVTRVAHRREAYR